MEKKLKQGIFGILLYLIIDRILCVTSNLTVKALVARPVDKDEQKVKVGEIIIILCVIYILKRM